MSATEETMKTEDKIDKVLVLVKHIDARLHALETSRTEERLLLLEKHRQECNDLHNQASVNNKRRDDSLDNLTKSNLLLTEAVNTMTTTITEFAVWMKTNSPLLSELQEVKTTLQVGSKWTKWFWRFLIGISAGILTLAALYNLVSGGMF